MKSKESKIEKIVSKKEEVSKEANLEQELSPEVIEKTMEKVQDTNAKGLAYSVIKNENLEQILNQGLLGTLTPREDITPAKWIRYGPERRTSVVYFSIVGRRYGRYWQPNELEIRNSLLMSVYSEPRIAIILDLTHFKEEIPSSLRSRLEKRIIPRSNTFWCDDPMVEESWERNFFGLRPRDRKILERIKSEREDITEKGEPKSSSDYGFALSPRVAPRLFRGIVCKAVRKKTDEEIIQDIKKRVSQGDIFIPGYPDLERMKEAEKKENYYSYTDKDPEIIRKMVEKTVFLMRKIYKGKEHLLLPIYDVHGNLWWPKKMSYEEVKRFVEEKHRGKKEDNNLSK